MTDHIGRNGQLFPTGTIQTRIAKAAQDAADRIIASNTEYTHGNECAQQPSGNRAKPQHNRRRREILTLATQTISGTEADKPKDDSQKTRQRSKQNHRHKADKPVAK